MRKKTSKNKTAHPRKKGIRRKRGKVDKIKQGDEQFKALLESAPDAMIIVGENGRILLVNAQVEKLFGYARHELIGEKIEKLVPEKFRHAHPSHRSMYFKNPKVRPMGIGNDLFGRRKDGTQFVAEISLSPIETPQGRWVTAAVRDVTERKRDMDERNRRMQETNRLKTEFLANMSHELRTPLNAIIGFTTLLRAGNAGPISETQKEYLSDVLTSSKHLLQLINDVLDLAKVESGKIQFTIENVHLQTIAYEVRDILRGLATERNIHVTVKVDPNLTYVKLDSRMLKQVFYNYLSNAIKFTPEKGNVNMRLAPYLHGMFRIEVEDTGIGIKSEDIRKLFVEFQQLDSGIAKKYPGTGLGLALTKRLVEALGGQVGVTSVPNQGSTFTAILPCNATKIATPNDKEGSGLFEHVEGERS